MSGSVGRPPPRRNPFSPMAVAKITGFEDSDAVDLTIETDAIRRATSYLTGYLEAAPAGAGQDRGGEVIAILGDYGTGKTHLAIELVRRAGQALDDPGQAMYLDATADGFVELYRRFMRKLGLAGVRKRVSDYYADIVAEELRSSGLEHVAVGWLSNRDLVPQEVVDKLGLMESALLRKVRRTLQRVTDNTSFGTALTLLLRSGFDPVVWSWLTGEEPDQVLVERGITRPIDSDVAALEAMGVFALLYGGRQARFVLVIDELDKIFSGANQPEEDTVTAFQKLMEVFGSAGACLVLSGLPEFRRVLHPSTGQRVSRAVVMEGLTTDEVCEFIERAQRPGSGAGELAPFTRDTVRYLRDITGGNARNVIRLCHDVYGIVDDERRATENPYVLVTDEMVRQAARRQFGTLDADDLDGVVRRVLDANGWNYQRKHVLDRLSNAVVDFWVTFRDRDGGCAVLLSESILHEADEDAVARRSFVVRESAVDAKLILVVSGVLTEGSAGRLAESLDAEPLVYSGRGFAENLRALVGAIRDQLPRVADSSPRAAILQRIEQVTRQQSGLYGSVERLADSSDHRFAAIQRDLAALTRAVQGATSPASAATPSALPAEVDRFFVDAVAVLGELTQIDEMMGDAFGRPSAETIQAVQRRLGATDLAEAVGVGLLMRQAVLAFRVSVVDWYTREVTAAVQLSRHAAERLDELCRAYDDVTEFLPTFKLDPLIRVGPWTAGSGAGAAGRSQSSRRDRVRAALDNLSPNVRRALPRSLPARGH